MQSVEKIIRRVSDIEDNGSNLSRTRNRQKTKQTSASTLSPGKEEAQRQKDDPHFPPPTGVRSQRSLPIAILQVPVQSSSLNACLFCIVLVPENYGPSIQKASDISCEAFSIPVPMEILRYP